MILSTVGYSDHFHECAIVIRRVEFDTLGWLASVVDQLLSGAGGALVGRLPQRACSARSAGCVLLFGRVLWRVRAEAIRNSELAQAKTLSIRNGGPTEDAGVAARPGFSDRQFTLSLLAEGVPI
jgi:hypothetical protein